MKDCKFLFVLFHRTLLLKFRILSKCQTKCTYLKRPVYILTSKCVIFVNIAWNGCMSKKIRKDCKVSFIHSNVISFFCLFWSNWIRSEWVCSELQHATLVVTELTKANIVKYQQEMTTLNFASGIIGSLFPATIWCCLVPLGASETFAWSLLKVYGC